MNPNQTTRADCVRRVLQRRAPERLVYAPNYWQWFTHHRHHGLLPPELRDCPSQLALIRHLGLDVFIPEFYFFAFYQMVYHYRYCPNF